MNSLKINQNEILHSKFDLRTALTHVALHGYIFCPDALSAKAREAAEAEAAALLFEDGEYVAKPISEYKNTRVTQAHERAYFAIGDWRVPVATAASNALVRKVNQIVMQVPAAGGLLRNLENWAPTEAGYQRYRNSNHHISPHRDRRTDQLLGATWTVKGVAPVRIYRPLGDPNDYDNLEVIDEFEAISGGLMLLRAPGFGSGEQVIHEVLSPIAGERLVLNLRMRPDVLKAPSKEACDE